MKITRSLATYTFLALITVSCDLATERELISVFGINFLAGDSAANSREIRLSASDIQKLRSMLGKKKPWKIGFPALKNKHPDAILRILGSPDFIRRDGKTQIWQYRSSGCILDMFIHGPQKNLKIIHLETRGRTVGTFPSDSCVTNLIISKVKQKYAFVVPTIKRCLNSYSS